jgi:hypothetical protein
VKLARSDVVAAAIPLALGLIVFAHVVRFPFVNWDDPSHFLQNPLAEHPLARGLRGLFATTEIGYPAPVLLLSFALDRALFGLHPGPYHAENVALHLANVAMLFALARRMRLTAKEACAVAAIFAIHPLVVEPVSWVTGRKDVLSTAMVLGAALIAAGRRGEERFASAGRWVVANLLAMLAVLVLPRMVVGPILVVIFVHAIRPLWGLPRIALRMAPALPFTLGVVFLGARQVAALGAVPSRHWVEVPLDLFAAWALQLGHVVWPVNLLAYYFRTPGDPPAWAMVLSAGAALGALVVVLRSPRGSPLRTGALLAAVAYAPVSSLFRIVRWTANSYMYVPLAGMSIAIVPLLARAWPKNLARFGTYAALALAAVVVLLSLNETVRWSSSTEVWAGSIARYPDEPLAYEHEAVGLLADDHVGESNAVFLRIAKRFPDWTDTLDDEARAYEAGGDDAQARQVLARGVRAGSATCTRMLWLRILATPDVPEAHDRDLVAAAFVLGFGAMKEGVHYPVFFLKLAAVLQANGLEDMAAQAAAHASELGETKGTAP